MFLRALKDEQKGLFLAIAEQAAKINGIVEEVEEEMLMAYADEMAIPAVTATAPAFEECLSMLKSMSSKKELNQIMYELVHLIVCDEEIDKAEMDLLSKIADSLDIKAEKIDAMIECAHSYSQLTRRINLLMLD